MELPVRNDAACCQTTLTHVTIISSVSVINVDGMVVVVVNDGEVPGC